MLWPASLVFRFFVFVRRLLYRLRLLKSVHPGVPVIIVGNLTVGGSGKTPLVLWIAEHLKAKGWSPAILSRGYGAKLSAPPCDTTACTERRRRAGSRSGPAGKRKPLPKPRESTTAISTSRRSA